MRQAKTPARILSICLLAGMASLAASSWAQSSASGFIQNMPADMQPDPAGPGSSRWLAPTANLGNYDKVLLESLTIYVSPTSEEKGLDADALKSLSESFRAIVTDRLEPAYAVVEKPGPGVLVLRPALTNVDLKKKSRGLLSFTPVGLVAYAARDAHTKQFSLERAVLEVEALDGASGERVAVLIDRTPQKTGGAEADKIDWSNLDGALSFYAQRLRERMNAARGK
jgi:hypothetical protein